jgi:hypothetical protein
MSGVSFGGSGGGGRGDPILENLAIIADPTKFQERLEALQKATLEATESWARIRKAETADLMFKDAEKAVTAARETGVAASREAEQRLAAAAAEAVKRIAEAKATAEDILSKAKLEADRLRASAKSARESAAAREAKATEVLDAATIKMAEANNTEKEVAAAAADVAAKEAAVLAQQKEVAEKIAALSNMASILNIKA